MFSWLVKRVLRIYFRARGFSFDPDVPASAKSRSVIIAAPHTSLPDIVLTFTALELVGVTPRIAVADKYAKWPIRMPLEAMGAIWINRNRGSSGTSYTDTLASLFTDHENLTLVVAAEGTRALREEWKTGFYHVARKAGVPICLGYLDYEKKLAGIGKEIEPGDDMHADMHELMAFYKDITPRHPEKFSLDTRFYP